MFLLKLKYTNEKCDDDICQQCLYNSYHYAHRPRIVSPNHFQWVVVVMVKQLSERCFVFALTNPDKLHTYRILYIKNDIILKFAHTAIQIHSKFSLIDRLAGTRRGNVSYA